MKLLREMPFEDRNQIFRNFGCVHHPEVSHGLDAWCFREQTFIFIKNIGSITWVTVVTGENLKDASDHLDYGVTIATATADKLYAVLQLLS